MAKGYTQEYGIDFYETFSLVVKMTTIRCIIALVASKHWPLHQLDINNAFLHGDLHEDVYMKSPEGLIHAPNLVCKLNKSLYGLKQASRQWFAKLTLELLHQGFTQSKNDYSLCTKCTPTSFTNASIYVHDILLTSNDASTIHKLKTHLDRVFNIKDLGTLRYFVGLEVSYLDQGIAITQHKFAKDLLHDSGLSSFKKTATPLPVNLKLHATDSPLYSNPTHYRSLVGKLNFLTHTRPDLAFTVQILSQFMQHPTEAHYQALTHTLNYVSSTIGHGILLKASDHLQLNAYFDSDWGACLDTRRPVTG